ncbi:MAG: hypothetical protein LBE44_01380 [Microbacterium hominis]|nr:hypothetical protein [Microbacterium hominis]
MPTQYYPRLVSHENLKSMFPRRTRLSICTLLQRDSWTAIMLSTPQSFNTSSLSIDSKLNRPISSRTSKDDFACPDCDADDPTQIAKQQAHHAETRAKWAALGYEVRPDGYPIVPGLTADDCKSYSPECRFTYRDTFLGWDFLVDLERARTTGSRLASRWDMRERALLAQLRASEDDVVSELLVSSLRRHVALTWRTCVPQYILEDRQKYDFRFTDEVPASAPLIQANNDPSHWHRDVSIAALQQLPHRILLVGSMHGSDRVRLTQEPEAEAWASTFARSMAFSNPWLMRPADAIVARLGGASNFVGVHARVGDGQFVRHARVNMERAWRSLADQLQVRADIAEEMWQHVKPAERVATSNTTTAEHRQSRKHRRHLGKIATGAEGTAADAGAVSSWAELDGPQDEKGEAAHAPSPKSRHVQRGLLADLWREWSSSGNPSDRLRNLTCRGALHADRRFSAFNTPLYLATDSRTPETDENLAVFFRSFPCTFILSDFGKADVDRNDGVVVESVSEMDRLVNELDGVRLGRLFLPFTEAIVAAKARVTVGTERSTFSGAYVACSGRRSHCVLTMPSLVVCGQPSPRVTCTMHTTHSLLLLLLLALPCIGTYLLNRGES